MEHVLELFDRIVNMDLLVRRVNVVAGRVIPEDEVTETPVYEQLDLFTDYGKIQKEREQEEKNLDKEKKLQHAVLDIQKKFGKNAVLRGMNLEEGATTIDRNQQIGGHKA